MASISDLTEQIKVYETKAYLVFSDCLPYFSMYLTTKVGRGKIVDELCTKIEMERPFFIRINPKS